MFTFTTVIPNMNNRQGINTINANKIGNNTVQQKDINWSKRILRNEALTHSYYSLFKLKEVIRYSSLNTLPESLYLTKVLVEILKSFMISLCLSYLFINSKVLALYK
jgi:hypothetical protein